MSKAGRWCRGAIAVLLLAQAWPAAAAAPVRRDDRELYRAVVERVRAGEGYYTVAAAEQRARNYPLRPALAMRPPTLAWALALLPSTIARVAMLWAGLFAVLVCWRNALNDRPKWEALLLSLLALAGFFGAFFPKSVYLHEQWSSALVLAALAAHRRPALMVALAFAAVLVRETAIAWLGAIVLVALWQRDVRKAVLAGGAVVLAAGLWLLHAQEVAAVGRAGDLASQGWVRFHGLPMAIDALRRNLLLYPLPGWLMLGAAAASLGAMLRWGGEAERIAAVGCTGFLLALTVLGRSDNAYWGFMVAPFVLLGLPLLARQVVLLRR
ncbi:hypothetical protein OLX02_04365 [Novosphingobium sp. KCTC 2891]|uniref:hypothetical protein n=1 Tax=Novosphingobium sp. KCTC 2891 TaxID=2989730 RepID=UPI0022214B54|nr:hypothetical protein [Novosphingobium sp. KCTC 2891]MCW1382049.1 hypothetical protein [Novosphingobium sp. KCTC 2891]